MKLAICINFLTNGAYISNSFAQSDYYFIYDMESKELVGKITNHIKSSIGAEVFFAQLLINQGINMLVCGICGKDAKRLFSEANIILLEHIKGNPGDFIKDFHINYRNDFIRHT
ncbi:MAG TPA: NifB/NifX family molybdenum-iron cluster-binding protein [Ignavibacteriaceae bacterium]